MTVGPLLKRLREAHGWSQRELGRRTKVRYSLISDLERGKKKDTQGYILLRLATELGVSVDDLLAGIPDYEALATPHA